MDNENNLQDGLTPGPSPKERGAKTSPGYMTVDSLKAKELIQLGKITVREQHRAKQFFGTI
jgi:hypothetical protein